MILNLYMVFLCSFVLAMALLPWLIRSLTRRRVEQVISEDVPEHLGKKGTPTLGGIGIVVPTALVCVAFAVLYPGAGSLIPLVVLLVVTSLLGFYDDYLILRHGRNAGQKWSHKIAAQLLIAAGFVFYVWQTQPALSRVNLPGLAAPLQLNWLWCPFAVLYMTGMSNAVNLSDGLDGLAGGLTIIAALGCAAAAQLTVGNTDVGVFCIALVGACLGFLWFNCHPAKIFMGNTSSISLGMTLGAAALLTRWELPLLITFGIFVAEALSVIIQVGYFKLTRRRIFKKAPVHHHFEMLGWKETRVVARFWIAAIILAVLAQGWISRR